MSAGIQLDKAGLDVNLGTITRTLNVVFTQVEQAQAWLAAQADADLETAPFGYSATDVANLKSAFADLDQLRTIYQGGATLAAAKDFRTFASRLWGLGF